MSGQITKVYEADTRRRWSEEEKLAIIEESKTAPVARVAKKHGVATSLLFRWRKLQGVQIRRPGVAAAERICPRGAASASRISQGSGRGRTRRWRKQD